MLLSLGDISSIVIVYLYIEDLWVIDIYVKFFIVYNIDNESSMFIIVKVIE